MLIGMDHAHLMPEHVAESTKFSSQLKKRLMKSMFGNQYILVGEEAPRLSWCDAMEADERSEAAARLRQRREECMKLAPEARQTALNHTHKLPRKLWDDKTETKKINHSVKTQPQGAEGCGPTCKERKKLWKEELTSLMTLVGAVATLLAVITPSEGAETEDGTDKCLKWEHEPGVAGLMNLDYLMVLLLVLMITTGLIVRVKRYLEEGNQGMRVPSCQELEVWTFPQPGEALQPSTKSSSKVGEMQVRLGYSCSAAGECAAEAAFKATQQRIAIT